MKKLFSEERDWHSLIRKGEELKKIVMNNERIRKEINAILRFRPRRSFRFMCFY